MKKIKYLLLSLVVFAVSCKEYTEGINQDPNAFSDAAPELTIGKAQLGWMQLAESNGARYAGIFMNQFTGEDRQYLTVDAYSITSGEFDDTWDDAYVDGITQAKIVEAKASALGNNLLTGVAQIVQAAIFGEMTALFGDIPYTEVSNANEFYTPAYDSQATVLAGVQDLLDKAIANVGSSAVSDGYVGNRLSSTATLAEIAYSLKARYYLVAKDYPNALTNAKKGIKNAGGTLSSLHGTSPENRNLYYQFMVDEREGYLGATGSYLQKLLDPADNSQTRLLATPGDAERYAYYFSNTDPNTSADGVFGQTKSFPLISYEEVKLIEAEAAQRTGDDMGAQTAFNAVRTALAAQYGASFPATTATGNDLLKQIIEEKYVSLIGQLTPFSDIRRTNNILGIPARTGNQIPQRFLYPQVEIDNNPNTPSPTPGLFDKTPVNN